MSMHPEYEAVIGLEVHCQLATDSKIFCGCRARLADGRSVADVAPNSNTCPICAGHPGTLPVINRKVLEYAVRAGVALNCRINLRNVFARKNYFYPDLPKGYQISQYDSPICEEGFLDIETSSGPRKISIQRIHMEEDAGKNIHMAGYSLVNLNRAGVPLVEIVSGPDLRTAEEAGAYLRALHSVVTFLEITDGNMQEGNFRCDANVSVRLKGAKELGTRAEIKNVNSFRFVEKAIEYEILRQIQVLQTGGKVIQETRGFDSSKNVTTSLRSKEEAQDYRYFPDPDLIAIQLEKGWVERIRSKLPELPQQKKARYIQDFGLAGADAEVLTSAKSLTEFFENTTEVLRERKKDLKSAGKSAANLITGEILRFLNEEAIEIGASRLTPVHVADIVELLQQQAISSSGGKQALGIAWKTGDRVDSIVEKQGLKQVSDTGAIEPAVDKVITSFPNQVAEFKSGKEKILGFLVGQVMKETGGKANPVVLQELLKKKLSS